MAYNKVCLACYWKLVDNNGFLIWFPFVTPINDKFILYLQYIGLIFGLYFEHNYVLSLHWDYLIQQNIF